jgi:hypothetical protein
MNRHLNIFHFFNNHEQQFIEDNISRGFAVCLQNDNQLLDNVLKNILPENIYQDLFNTDEPNYYLQIDVQRNTNELSGFNNIIAVACSETEIKDFTIFSARKTENPITDLTIEIRDTCIIFEFKRTEEDCGSQLKGQAEKVKENSETENEIIYKDFSWEKIVKLILNVLSFQKQVNNENQFTKDYKEFIENKYPKWFPHRLLKNIEYPNDTVKYDTKNHYYLNRRLSEIKNQVFGQEFTKYIADRHIIAQDFGWVNEIHVGYKENKEFINVSIFPGDTKAQGLHFFKPNKNIEIPKKIRDYDVYFEPYIKFSHFNSGLFWLNPKEKFPLTHNFNFFKQFARRWKKVKWEIFKKELNEIIPNWYNADRCEWINKIEKTNRTYFDLSVGIYIAVYIPFKIAQKMDNSVLHSDFAKEIKEIIFELKNLIDK